MLPTRFLVSRGTQGTSRSFRPFVYRSLTFCALPSQYSSTRPEISYSFVSLQQHALAPSTPTLQRLQPSTQRGFRLLPFRSPLLRECSLFLRDVSVPRVPPAHPMYSDDSAWAFPQAGFPIRISPALTLDDSSPRLFAAIHVLLRLLAPRHPPYALTNLIHVRRHSLNVFYKRLL